MNHSRSPQREELMIDLQDRLSSRIGFLVDPGQSWMEIGLDSVIACAFLSEINRCYDSSLTLEILHRHPTLSALATFMDRLGLERIRAPSSHEPVRIAVIGMAGRFPEADTPEALWKHLAEGKCSVTSIPSERHRYWDQAKLAAREGSTFVHGAFLSDVERFDPLFFGISPKEAGVMDPQQRIFLEEAWKAFEEAGYSPEALSGEKCGVYAGVMVNDYHDLLTQWGEASVHELMDTASFLPARIAYHLNLTGPALAIDTASSSSLVALDMACRALAAGEIDLALAGGATLYLTQKRYTLMEKAGMLTPTGECRVFDTAADGMMPGEAVGVVLLKRLSDAVRDRDAIHGVILASGTGQSGKTVGITAPSVEAQADLMEKVCREGGINPATVSLIEAHGTGTRLGDPAEAKALHRAYGSAAAQGSIALGSLKANIGHSFAAAGVSGLIKVLLAMKHRALPPQIHVSEPQPLLRIGSGPFRLPQALEAWETPEGAPRRAAICGVGFSGTNAHLIVEEAPPRERNADAGDGYWFTLSAPGESALKRRAASLLAWIEAQDDFALRDVSFTLTTGRAALEERLAFHASTREEVATALEAFLKGEPDRYLRGRATSSGKPGGPEEWVHGAAVDWAGMTADLEAYRIHLPPDPLDGMPYWYDRSAVMEKQSPEKLPPERPRPLMTPATPSQPRQAETTAGRTPIRLKPLAPLVTTAPAPGQPAKEHTETAPGGAPHEIRTLVRSMVAKTLYLEADQIRDDRRFQDLGFDSILAVDLAKAVSATFGISFSAAALYDHPSVQALADHLASQGGAPVSQTTEAPLPLPEPAHKEIPSVTSGATGPQPEEVAKLAAGVLYLAPEKVRADARFADLGLDSILAVELARAIAARWQVAFTAAELYSYPTPTAVAEMLQGTVVPTAPVAPVLPVVPEPVHVPAPVPVKPSAVPSLTPAKPACDEPIAVIGFSGRFPGAADTDAFWQQIAEGRSAIGLSPAERWEEPLQGGWLEGIDRFDAAFFRIAPPEAEAMDPQHRLFLQQAWATLEQAGYTPEELSRRTCGIFVGMGASDYSGDTACPHTLLGNTGSGLTARLAFLFDWKGPTMVVDTACASSLSALYLAARSLQNRECDVALAGGVHLASTPRIVEEARAMGLLSPSGTCRTFDAEADGFVIGEGVGAVLVKRLADAERDGDTIHGVIRAIGVSQDGARHGLSAPQASGQAALQQRVYERAGISPSELQYIELHGMSSPLSDEIELLALKQSFQGTTTLPEGSIAIGSVKPNIGHPLAASGMAGLIKLLLALRHRRIPPVGGLQTPNPALALEGTPFRIATSLTPWEASPRRAALNGLSATGTNCHLVLEDYPAPSSIDKGPALLVLSARSPEALKARATDLLAALDSEAFGLSDVAYTLQTGRRPMTHRLAFVARSMEEARAALGRFLERHVADFSGTLHLGEVREADGMADLLISGEEGRLFLSVAVQQGAFDKLARLWVSGANIDFQLLHPAGRSRRVPLPTYPFEEESYWKPPGRSVAPAPAVPERPDALLPSPQESLCRWIEEALRLPVGGLSEESSLNALGFGSLYALSVSGRYEARYGVRLPLRFFYEARTVGDLCRRVAAHYQPVIPSGSLALSEGQKALWSLMSREPTAYLIPVALRLKTGTVERITAVLQSLADEHPALRTLFQWDQGEPVRHLLSDFKVVVDVLSPTQRDHLQRLAHRPLDPATGPLWRAEWLPGSREGEEGIVLLTFHHLIFDGYSLGVLLEAFLGRHAALERGEALAPRQEVADHAFFEQERRYLASASYQEDRSWWLSHHPKRWQGGLLPAKHSGTDGALWVGEVAPALVQRLAALAAREQVTLQAVMLAACEALLGSRVPELVLGLPVDLRPESEHEPLGYFVNLIALRSRWQGECSFAAWCAERFTALLGGLEHRAFPYRHLAQAMTERDGGTPPALEAAFYFLTWPNATRRHAFEQLEHGIHQTGEFPLVIEVIEGSDAWRLHLKYLPAHLSAPEVEQLAADYLALLEAVADNASLKLSELPIAARQPAQEPMRFPSDKTVARLFEEQAHRSPEALAAAFEDESRSYAALDAEANQWAHYLIAQGVRPGMLVGVMWPRSLEMLIALLAVWKAGATYVPLDPGYPAERIAMIVEDARLPFLLLPPGTSGPERPGLTLLQPTRAAVEPQPISPPAADAEAAGSLAYVIFTSGSTGRPKGVQIAHRSLAHFLWCMADRPGCGPGDRVLALTTISFDIAALELFLPLITGALVDVLPESVARNGLRLCEAIVHRRPTLVQATPATWKMLLLAKLPELQGLKALCGGEAWDEALAAELLPRVGELWNMYGPTETTIWSSIARVLPGEPVRLGEPIGNTQFYVLDETLRPVPKGEIGELYIGGDGLAKGYLHRPDLTSERFIPHPDHPGELIYRTGDLVRYV